jgi:hypothetical protein
MDPIQINITIDLGQKTLEVIRSFNKIVKEEDIVSIHSPRSLETKDAKAVEPKPAPAAPQAEPVANDPEPVADLPAEIAEISDEDLRALVKKAKNASSPTDVRAVFAEFGIRTSIDCPQERRADLVARLNKLAA